MSKISELVAFAKSDDTNEYRNINFSQVPNYQAQNIMRLTGIDVKSAIKLLSASGIRHAFSSHGNDILERERGQIGIVDADFEKIPGILLNPDTITKNILNKRDKDSLIFTKVINARTYFVIMSLNYRRSGNELVFNTMYIKG